MKILILTQYFPPEVGAPQNRLFELAVRLKNKGATVSILTAMPNYPQMEIEESYKDKYYCQEQMEGLMIYRSWIFVSKSKSIFKRLLNYFSFVISSFIIGSYKLDKQDYILCESPPLFLGITAFLLKTVKKARLIFNVSDLWPESAEKLGLVNNKVLLSLSTKLEEFLYRNAHIISCQTQGIASNISARFPLKNVYWLPNGVDLSYYSYQDVQGNWRKLMGYDESDLLFLYAGIIGYAQGLEVILKAASRLKHHETVKFIILGSGPEKNKLIELAKALELKNVKFLDSVKKNEMPQIVKAIDVSIVPLKKLDLFKGAIPSKIFENLAMKKPILLGVEGEAKELFITEGKAGFFFEPENELDLADKILAIFNDRSTITQLGENGYTYVSKKFTRDIIATNFWDYLLNKE